LIKYFVIAPLYSYKYTYLLRAIRFLDALVNRLYSLKMQNLFKCSRHAAGMKKFIYFTLTRPLLEIFISTPNLVINRSLLKMRFVNKIEIQSHGNYFPLKMFKHIHGSRFAALRQTSPLWKQIYRREMITWSISSLVKIRKISVLSVSHCLQYNKNYYHRSFFFTRSHKLLVLSRKYISVGVANFFSGDSR
jgi:hypothetical protein